MKMRAGLGLPVLSVLLGCIVAASAHKQSQSMPGMKPPSPVSAPSPSASNKLSEPHPAPSPPTKMNMPRVEMGPMNAGGPLVMSGDQMAVRIGGSDSQFMFIGQMGSGTSWQPSSTSTYMVDNVSGDWLLMFHYNLSAGLNHQGGPRGATKFESANWFMPEAFHRLGKGTVELRGMFSAEPFSFAPGGSPLLFQTGESYKGQPLIDRQHPHDLFMELSAQYTLPLGERGTWFTYFGYPGEPALGPVSFMHRGSAGENPAAPLAHHLQDSTHISFGVFTTGFTYRWLKVEGSVFNGHEPDENRYDIEAHRWNSCSVRLSFAPNRSWTMQISHGLLRNPEALELGTTRRTTASISYNWPFTHGSWAASLIWGRNHENHANEIFNLNGYTAETTVNFRDRNYLYGRLELADKNELLRAVDRIKLGITQDHPSFRIGAYTVGAVRDILTTKTISLGVGTDFTVYSKPAALNPVYGEHPSSYRIFLRLRPNKMKMTDAMDGRHDEQMPALSSQPPIDAGDGDNKHPASDFALTDQDGKLFLLSQLRGKVVLLFFGYTHCPDACPTTMAKLSRVYKLLGADTEKAVTLFVSVDPDRDTTSVLKSYLAYFHMNSIGLTGTKEEIDAVVKQYGARYEIEQSDSAAGYHINHSTDLYLLNRKGELSSTFTYSAGTQEIASAVNKVLR